MAKGYLLGQPGQPGMWVDERDAWHMRETDIAVMPDLVRVKSEHVVIELDENSGKARPIGLVNTSNPVHMQRLIGSLHHRRAWNRMVRLRDLCDTTTIRARTNRSKPAVQKWVSARNFPAPLFVAGGLIKVWYWPDVRAWIWRQGLPFVLKETTE